MSALAAVLASVAVIYAPCPPLPNAGGCAIFTDPENPVIYVKPASRYGERWARAHEAGHVWLFQHGLEYANEGLASGFARCQLRGPRPYGWPLKDPALCALIFNLHHQQEGAK